MCPHQVQLAEERQPLRSPRAIVSENGENDLVVVRIRLARWNPSLPIGAYCSEQPSGILPEAGISHQCLGRDPPLRKQMAKARGSTLPVLHMNQVAILAQEVTYLDITRCSLAASKQPIEESQPRLFRGDRLL